jgi:hypothetical protein
VSVLESGLLRSFHEVTSNLAQRDDNVEELETGGVKLCHQRIPFSGPNSPALASLDGRRTHPASGAP